MFFKVGLKQTKEDNIVMGILRKNTGNGIRRQNIRRDFENEVKYVIEKWMEGDYDNTVKD